MIMIIIIIIRLSQNVLLNTIAINIVQLGPHAQKHTIQDVTERLPWILEHSSSLTWLNVCKLRLAGQSKTLISKRGPAALRWQQ